MSYTYPGMAHPQNRGKTPGMIMIIVGAVCLVFFLTSLIEIQNGIKLFTPNPVLFYSFPVVACVSLIVGLVIWKWDTAQMA